MSNISSAACPYLLLFFILLSAAGTAQSTITLNISTSPNPDIFEPPAYPVTMKNKVVYARTSENFTIQVRNNGPQPVWRIEIRIPKLLTSEDRYRGINNPQLMYEVPYTGLDSTYVDCPNPNGLTEWGKTETLYYSANGTPLAEIIVCTHSGITNRLDTSKSTEINFTGYAVQPYWTDENLSWNITAYFGQSGVGAGQQT